VVYVNKERNPVDVAISGHEYESSYSDGSTSLSQVLESPSIELLLRLA